MLAHKSSSKIALTRPPGWDRSCKLYYCCDLPGMQLGLTKVVSQLSCNFQNGELCVGRYCHLASLGWSLLDSHGTLMPSGHCHSWLTQTCQISQLQWHSPLPVLIAQGQCVESSKRDLSLLREPIICGGALWPACQLWCTIYVIWHQFSILWHFVFRSSLHLDLWHRIGCVGGLFILHHLKQHPIDPPSCPLTNKHPLSLTPKSTIFHFPLIPYFDHQLPSAPQYY